MKTSVIIGLIMLLPGMQAVGGFINADEIEAAGAEQLMSEVALLEGIGKGILLSISQCENDEACQGLIDRTEVQQLIDAIKQRVQSLDERRAAAGEAADGPANDPGLEDALLAYVEQRDNLTEYLERINLIVPDDRVEDGLGNDFFGIIGVPSITELYSVFNDVDEELEDDIFQPAGEETDEERPPEYNIEASAAARQDNAPQ